MKLHLTTRDVAAIAAKCQNVTLGDVLGHKRSRDFVWARFATVLIVKELFPERPYTQIGTALGGRDHSTIIYALEKAETLLEYEVKFAHLVRRVKAVIEGRIPVKMVDVEIKPTPYTLEHLPKIEQGMDGGMIDQVNRHRGSLLLIDAIRQARAAA